MHTRHMSSYLLLCGAIAPARLMRVFYRVGEQPTPRRTPLLLQSSALPRRSPPATSSWTGRSGDVVQPAVYRGEPFQLKRIYHGGYYSYCDTPPPVLYASQSPEVQNTPLMLFAFHEGVILPQTYQSGYIYFQKATEPGQRVTLHVHVQDAASLHHDTPAESAVEFRLPFARC